MNLIDTLPEDLLIEAYIAGGEAAWPREKALEVVNFLSKNSLPVCGIEIWLPTDPGPTIPTPYIYTWEARPIKENEERSFYVKGTNEEARQYIRTFEWDERDKYKVLEPYFNIEVCE
jgi:hypothetical protein